MYQPLRDLLAYTAETGCLSVIADRVKPITSLIIQNFYHPFSSHQESPMNITPYNLVSLIPRSDSDPKTAFIQCVRHSKFGSIFGLILPDITPYITTYCNLVPHYINAKLKDVGAQDLLPRVLAPDTITEVPQYEFNMESINVYPKNVKISSQEKDPKGITGLKSIKNTFKVINIQ